MELYTDGSAWYLTKKGEQIGWCWQRVGTEWAVERAALPTGAVRGRVDELPPELQEELLAFAARSAAMEIQP